MTCSCLDARKLALAGLAGCLAVLAGAWAFQLIGGYVPCKLCLMQREGYYTALPLLVGAFVAARRWPACVSRGLFVLAALFILSSMATGVYQAGAEWGFWPGPSDCGGGALQSSSGSLLDAMQGTRVIFCDEAALRILGLSFAGWNVLVAGFLALVCLAGAIARGHRD